MKISFEGEHKSLNSFKSDPLNDFTVITGENGSGKSQLIELITDYKFGKIQLPDKFEFHPIISNIQFEGIETSQFSVLGRQTWIRKIEECTNSYRRMKSSGRKFAHFLISNNIWLNEDGIRFLINQQESIPKLMELIKGTMKEGNSYHFNEGFDLKETLKSISSSGNFITKKEALIANEVAVFFNKPFESLVEADFFKCPIDLNYLEDQRLFGSQIEFKFYHYLKTRELHSRLNYEKDKYRIDSNSLSDEEFDVKYPIAPWEQVNLILEKTNLDFRFKDITRQDFSPDGNVYFELIKTTIGKPIDFNDLSTGEKIILGLIMKLFTGENYIKHLEFPELIVLDEPDAHLHPQMSKLLIDVLNETFVKKLGIKVIMTTHSPSTIALCPEDSIYQLKNHPETSLKKIGKDEALKILTGFLPTLSIDYKNHKQVFVESPTDCYYYQTVFTKLSEEKQYPFKLYFISNAMGRGNCEQVIKVVSDLREYGNNTCFGIIDWDLKNNPNEFVKIHGYKERYSLENFLYDPIYIAVLLMDMDGAHNIFQCIGKEQTYNQFSIGGEDNAFLQKIIDWFFKEYYLKYNVKDEEKSTLIQVDYYNGKTVQMPKWFLEFQGHDYETKLRELFPALNKFPMGGAELQNKLIKIIAKCFPFIPMRSVELIEEIINWD